MRTTRRLSPSIEPLECRALLSTVAIAAKHHHTVALPAPVNEQVGVLDGVWASPTTHGEAIYTQNFEGTGFVVGMSGRAPVTGDIKFPGITKEGEVKGTLIMFDSVEHDTILVHVFGRYTPGTPGPNPTTTEFLVFAHKKGDRTIRGRLELTETSNPGGLSGTFAIKLTTEFPVRRHHGRP